MTAGYLSCWGALSMTGDLGDRPYAYSSESY